MEVYSRFLPMLLAPNKYLCGQLVITRSYKTQNLFAFLSIAILSEAIFTRTYILIYFLVQ